MKCNKCDEKIHEKFIKKKIVGSGHFAICPNCNFINNIKTRAHGDGQRKTVTTFLERRKTAR